MTRSQQGLPSKGRGAIEHWLKWHQWRQLWQWRQSWSMIGDPMATIVIQWRKGVIVTIVTVSIIGTNCKICDPFATMSPMTTYVLMHNGFRSSLSPLNLHWSQWHYCSIISVSRHLRRQLKWIAIVTKWRSWPWHNGTMMVLVINGDRKWS